VFSVSTAYMPKEGELLAVVDPYVHSLQWSREPLHKSANRVVLE
jgi:hypothetical protein